MIYTVKINDKGYEVEVEKGKANIIKTTEGVSQNTPAPVIASASAPSQASQAAPAVSAGSEIIKSPMPGTIIDIKVSQGTRVKKGEILLILEAMKMENEIMAPYDGIVTQVFTSKGSSVSTNDNLISIN
jgi:biotin carboxyl carrier protein